MKNADLKRMIMNGEFDDVMFAQKKGLKKFKFDERHESRGKRKIVRASKFQEQAFH